MIESEIIISPVKIPKKGADLPTQYQEWVARFCYASAKLPPATVEHVLSLLETCGDSVNPDHEQ